MQLSSSAPPLALMLLVGDRYSWVALANSLDWATHYPAGSAIADPARLPQSWKDKLASLNIPDIKPSSPNNGYPTYANGEKPNDDTICSFTYECVDDEDLHNPPDGVFAVSRHQRLD